MIKLAVGFFGFTRKLITPELFDNFLTMLPECEIDIYVSTPNKINEYDSDEMDEKMYTEELQKIFKHCKLYIDVYKYNPLVFIKRTKELNLPDYTDVPVYRMLSQHFSIGNLSKNIINSSQMYDNIILTRFDIFPSLKINTQLLNKHNKDIIFIYRTAPYISKTDAEDRVILSSLLGVSKLANLYYLNNIEKEIINEIYSEPYPERILCKFINIFSDLRKVFQHGISIDMSKYMNIKYSNMSKDVLNNLLKENEDYPL